MTLLITILLVVIVFYIYHMRHYKTSLAILFLTVLFFVGVGSGILPALLLDHLQSSYKMMAKNTWGNHNAIVLLGGGTIKTPRGHQIVPPMLTYSRLYETARLYLLCKKSRAFCTIIISGGDPAHNGKSEAYVYQQALLDLNIPADKIILEPHSLNTYANAEFTSSILKTRRYDHIMLVTSGIHMQRALLYFLHFGIHAFPAPADYLTSISSIAPLAYNFTVTDFALHEYLGELRFDLYNFMGWNK